MLLQQLKFTVCMPTGGFICPISPARKGEWKEKENEKMRNEGRAAAGRQNVLNKYEHRSPTNSAVPVRPVQLSKFTVCMPTGRFICPISPAKKGEWKKKENEK